MTLSPDPPVTDLFEHQLTQLRTGREHLRDALESADEEQRLWPELRQIVQNEVLPNLKTGHVLLKPYTRSKRWFYLISFLWWQVMLRSLPKRHPQGIGLIIGIIWLRIIQVWVVVWRWLLVGIGIVLVAVLSIYIWQNWNSLISWIQSQ